MKSIANLIGNPCISRVVIRSINLIFLVGKITKKTV